MIGPFVFLPIRGIETFARSEVSTALGNDEQGALDPGGVFELERAAGPPQSAGTGAFLHRHAQRRMSGAA